MNFNVLEGEDAEKLQLNSEKSPTLKVWRFREVPGVHQSLMSVCRIQCTDGSSHSLLYGCAERLRGVHPLPWSSTRRFLFPQSVKVNKSIRRLLYAEKMKTKKKRSCLLNSRARGHALGIINTPKTNRFYPMAKFTRIATN